MNDTFWGYLKGAAKGVTFGVCIGVLIVGLLVLGACIFDWAVTFMPVYVALAVMSAIVAVILVFGIALSLMFADWVLK